MDTALRAEGLLDLKALWRYRQVNVASQAQFCIRSLRAV